MRGLGTIINALAIVIGAVLNNLSLVGNILIFCVASIWCGQEPSRGQTCCRPFWLQWR